MASSPEASLSRDLSWPNEKLGARIGGWAGSIAFLPPTVRPAPPHREVWPGLPDTTALGILWYRKRDTDGSRRSTGPMGCYGQGSTQGLG
jgi:hypothetical protein